MSLDERVTEYRPDSTGHLRPTARRDRRLGISLRDTTQQTGASSSVLTDSTSHDGKVHSTTKTKTQPASPNLYIIGGLILSILLNVWLIGRSIKRSLKPY